MTLPFMNGPVQVCVATDDANDFLFVAVRCILGPARRLYAFDSGRLVVLGHGGLDSRME